MKQHLKILFPFFLFFIALIFFVSNNFFFWDTIHLVSAPAHFFYENNFKTLILPAEIDTGHIPTLGYYIALVWKVFGKNLVVAHLAMLPFVLGIVFQVFLLVKHFVSSPNFVVWAMMLILSDATLLSQMILISPDIVLLFFFLLGLNAIISQKRNFLLLALFGLFLISMRGIVVVFSILLIDIILSIRKEGFNDFLSQFFKKKYIAYIAPFLLFLTYHYFHYIETGWVWTHPDSAWKPGRETNSFGGLFYNLGIFSWRILDFGRVFIVIGLSLLLFLNKKSLFQHKKTIPLLIIVGIVCCIFIIPFLYYKTLTQHRYLLPLYFLIALLASYCIHHAFFSNRVKTSIFSILILGVLTGNFLVYPDKIAQGWDASLAHIPFYSLQQKMNTYLDKNQITFSEVGTAFPMLGEHSVIFVNNDIRSFKPKEVGKDTYILYSNVNNDFSDSELNRLSNQYIIEKKITSPTIYLCLFKLKK